ncbi:MAG: polysaccharide deacetylase family protein [Chitinophagales bacterium]|nr:polysaccharide deacetylase family protein [Chitinophagales bacterium]
MRPFILANIILVLCLLGIDVLYLSGAIDWWWLLIPVVIYIHLLVFGAIFIQWNFYVKSYNKGVQSKQVALTFDDGPAQYTSVILDVLKKEGVQAAFFSIGKNAVANPEIVKRWHSDGHLIGNHSYDHGFNFDWKTSKAMQEEINKTNNAIMQIAGVTPKLFRPPYGVTNPNLAKAITRSDMYSIGWNVRSFDTTAKNKADLEARILNRLKGGDIVLLHDSQQITAEILTDLIRTAREKGFTFVRVDKLLDLKPYA